MMETVHIVFSLFLININVNININIIPLPLPLPLLHYPLFFLICPFIFSPLSNNGDFPHLSPLPPRWIPAATLSRRSPATSEAGSPAAAAAIADRAAEIAPMSSDPSDLWSEQGEVLDSLFIRSTWSGLDAPVLRFGWIGAESGVWFGWKWRRLCDRCGGWGECGFIDGLYVGCDKVLDPVTSLLEWRGFG